ncbi:MAG: histidine phosphatase family protein [Actinomycetota bacterium]|nr:histidine phosphatase family protein [Actinomycetota bacterium]
MRVVLVRHAESLWNAAELVQGQGGPGLTTLGAAQAQATAEMLAARCPRPALAVRSDLPRVAETAAPAERLLGVPVTVDAQLREIDVGRWSGRTWDDIAVDEPGAVAAIRRGEDVVRGGKESWADVRARTRAALRRLLDEASGGDGEDGLLVFSHGGPIRMAVADVLGLAPGGEGVLEDVGNCSLTELRVGADGSGLVVYNETGHLTDLGVGGTVSGTDRAPA